MNSFYPDAIKSWNNLGHAFTSAQSLASFKNSLLKLLRPDKKEVFKIHDFQGLSWLYQLRVGLSPLKNHKKNHNFLDSVNDVCLCSQGSETTIHFLLRCPLYTTFRDTLLFNLNPILNRYDLMDLPLERKVHIFLYGHYKMNDDDNSSVLKTRSSLFEILVDSQ